MLECRGAIISQGVFEGLRTLSTTLAHWSHTIDPFPPEVPGKTSAGQAEMNFAPCFGSLIRVLCFKVPKEFYTGSTGL